MPATSDILQFLHGQLLQTPQLPSTSFSGKTIIITGANGGLGFECAKHLTLSHSPPATLILACRSLSSATSARTRLLSSLSPGAPVPSIHVYPLDLASFTSVQTFAASVLKDFPKIDALIANAGISTNRFNLAEKFEETLTVNVVSTFLLAMLLLPRIEESVKGRDEPGHVVIVGSNVHAFAPEAQIGEGTRRGEGRGEGLFAALSEEGEADMGGRYFLSKLLVQLCVGGMAARVGPEGSNVVVNCPSPGWCKTALFRTDDGGFWGRNLLRLIGWEPEVGARTFVHAVAAGRETHGRYLSEGMVKRESAWVRSEEGKKMQGQVWKELEGVLDGIVPGVVERGMGKKSDR